LLQCFDVGNQTCTYARRGLVPDPNDAGRIILIKARDKTGNFARANIKRCIHIALCCARFIE